MMVDVVKKINKKTKFMGDLTERIDRKVYPLYFEYLDETTLDNDVEGSGGGLHSKDTSGSNLTGCRIDKKTKETLHSLIRFENTSYHNYPDSGYGGDDDYSIRNRRVDKKKTRWLKVKDTFLDLFVMDVIDDVEDTTIETDDEKLPDDKPKDFNESGVLSNKSSKSKKRYGKKYYSRNRLKILRNKRRERKQTLNKKKTDYRKNRNKKILTPTGKKKIMYHTKNHLDK